ncbi:alpha/beta hydrolase [Hymenobacter busanensis]|uniref:Alpha/beta hydrolase n=1 Tax=Hymenobacter busanensis TaxID=2607656 RepID=A0A7L4ZW64_9BACT|nr:alpha/beta hydrolase [Hymenobacter busanensis]KAA9339153.1 alpha/beta hydrolase [Hymenobacter busanensis]QHJ07085.1 alpha/beta fold hydrolase [Hymenobacter busanensis]
MKRTASFLRLAAAALLLSATSAALPAVAAIPASRVADNPAAHPNFTVRVVGKGQPVLLIPGLTCPGAVWDETVAHYQTQYQCHVVSLAGFGGAAAPASTEHLLQNVRDQLLAYIKTQKLTRPAIIGHSLGGFMALWMSATQPEAVGPLVIVDSLPFLSAIQNPALTAEAAKPQAEATRQQMSRGGKMPAAMQRQMLASMITDTARMTVAGRWSTASDPATVAQAMYDMSTTDLRADVARIQQPVLVLGAWAAYKPYGATKESTRAIFAQQYAKLPQHRIEMSEAGKHFLMWDDTQWFLNQADAFLQQHAPAKKAAGKTKQS